MLYVRRKAAFSPMIHRGHQERNLRGGTECVPLIVRIGKAAELARKHLPEYEKKVRPLRDGLEEGILSSMSNTELNGHKSQRPANPTNISFHGIPIKRRTRNPFRTGNLCLLAENLSLVSERCWNAPVG